MFKISAYFIKEQIAGTTIPQLLLLYQSELENQGVSSANTQENSIEFSNDILNAAFMAAVMFSLLFPEGR